MDDETAMTEPAGVTEAGAARRARQRLVIAAGAAVFAVLLAVGMIAESDAVLTVVGIYAIAGGILLGRVLASWEPVTAPDRSGDEA